MQGGKAVPGSDGFETWKNTRVLRWITIGLLLCGAGMAQEKLVPGLLGDYRDAHRSIQLVVSSPNFFLEAAESPHPSLAPEFKARWTGAILILRAGTYSFRGARAAIEGAAVGEDGVPLDPGRHAIEVSYERKPGAATLRLEWMAGHFDWEPVPSDRFLHDERSVDARAVAVEQGRHLAEKLGCANCHRAESASLRARPGPSLTAIGSRRKRAWLYHWLRDPAAFQADAVMPSMLANDQQRRDVAAFLAASVAGNVAGEPSKDPVKIARRESDTGRSLFAPLGCGACHQRDSLSLDGLGSKMDAAALVAYLENPGLHDASGEMPSLALSSEEATQLAGFLLLSRNPAFEEDFEHGAAERGAALVRSAGCAACHTVDGGGSLTGGSQAPALSKLNTGRGCLADNPGPVVPRYRLSPADRASLAAFIAWYRENPDISSAPVYDFYRRVADLRCTTCHAMDAALPTSAIAEKAPPLTGLGARLAPQWLREVLVEGRRSHAEFELRMPHYSSDHVKPLIDGFARAAGLQPGAAPTAPPQASSVSTTGVQMLGTNASQGGLGCIGCHGFGEHNALGEEGPALTHVARRVRYDWFQRWMRDPARILSGTSMPNYFGSLPADEARGKIAALWAALSLGDKMPLPEGFEQAESKPGSEEMPVPSSKPIVIRWDMPEATPAAIAVGLPGAVSYCFDAGESRLRYAWLGGFVDMTGTLFEKRDSETKLTRTADVLGDVFYRGDEFPFRVGKSRRIPQRRFRGYRLIEGYPEFRYEIDGVEVRERVTATGDRNGIVRSFLLSNVDQPIWFLAPEGDGYAIESSLPASAGEIRIPAGTNIEFQITLYKVRSN